MSFSKSGNKKGGSPLQRNRTPACTISEADCRLFSFSSLLAAGRKMCFCHRRAEKSCFQSKRAFQESGGHPYLSGEKEKWFFPKYTPALFNQSFVFNYTFGRLNQRGKQTKIRGLLFREVFPPFLEHLLSQTRSNLPAGSPEGRKEFQGFPTRFLACF